MLFRSPVHPDSIDAVVLTHAHIDHTGWLPRLVAQGFKGPVYCTGGTADICQLVLPDAAHLQEEDAKFANARGYSKHHPAMPLYTKEDAAEALSRLKPSPFGKKIFVGKGIQAEFINAGHLLGSSYVLVTRTDGSGGRILFGGDLGRYNRPILPDPSPAVAADVLLVESTYGDRKHPEEDDGSTLATIIRTPNASCTERPERRKTTAAIASEAKAVHCCHKWRCPQNRLRPSRGR